MRSCWWLLAATLAAADWSGFRGPNASGVAPDTGLPVEFGPSKNVEWRTPLPPGHSSPSLAGDRIFITAHESEKLFVFALDRADGRILWRREVPRPRRERLHLVNGPASPTPATDGRNVYAFFGDFGLISFGPDGNERWRLPLGPFNTPMGMSASPVLAGATLLQSLDQETGSYFLAIDKDTGKEKWSVDRAEYTRGFSTPVLWRPEGGGGLQAVLAGSYRLNSYEVATGRLAWWIGGLTWQLKPTPVIDGGRVYVVGWAGESDPGQQEIVPPFEEALARWDSDKDRKLSKSEIAEERITRQWHECDLDVDGFLGERDWKLFRTRRAAVNSVSAYRLGGRGDMTERSTLWQYHKALPNVPSPLVYRGVLYMVKDGGILTSLDPETGAVLKQGRLAGALGSYYSSPVAAGGKVYAASEEGKVAVLKAAGEWEILAVNALDDGCHATPAIAGGTLYVRTHSALYAFRKKD
jgi:outer membrane protein assembly factor BamB